MISANPIKVAIKLLVCCAAGASIELARLHADIAVVARPYPAVTNGFYVSNRAPLVPSQFIPLPIGAVQPKGWLLEIMKRQRDGLCGNLGEISVWLQKEDNAWLSKDGKGKYGWEELPYWLKGYIQLAYIFNDPKMIAESQVWINGALNSQRPNGDFGPDQKFDDDHTRDFWANMTMMFCLETYYEHSHDPRVIELMTKYFKYHRTIPDNQLLTHYWQKMRGGDELYSIYWLYNRTGDAFLLELADKIHRVTANWEMPGDLPNWHNVNIAEAFREPATYYLQSHKSADLQASYADFKEVRKRFGQVPGGMFGGDENCRPGYSDPRQAVETCGMVEQMLSDELLMQMSGDPFWADNCENVAFNTYPAALTPDMRALRYLTAPNMVVSDSKNHAPGIQNDGPFLMMNPFSSRCCQHNHSMGWPYFTKHLWLATPDNGLCAAVFSASEVSAQIGDGANVRLTEETHYPFDGDIRFTLHTDKSVTFPLYLRIPGWSQGATVSVNGKKLSVTPEADKYVWIQCEWKNNDVVTLNLPMELSVQTWTANHDSVSLNYGPLTFSLKIGERIEQVDSSKTAIGDSGWQKDADPAKWPSFEYYPTTPWNYGLVLDDAHPQKSFTVKKLAWPKDDFPFTPESAPIEILAKGRQIPQWTVDKYGLCAVLQQSPAFSDQPVQDITLIPMGSTRLRISAFPTVRTNAGAHKWRPSLNANPTNETTVVPAAKWDFHEITVSGIVGFQDTPMEPDGQWHVHDPARTQPPVIAPGTSFSENAPPPGDAIVLFDGRELFQWTDSQGRPAPWVIKDGAAITTATDIFTKQKFGDIQLHLEFREPAPATDLGQNRGNSGVFFMGRYEIQLLDCFDNKTYADGTTGAIYAQHPPLANACRPPGEWETYDILFTAPRRGADGKVTTPAYATVILNGVVVQNHQVFRGTTTHCAVGAYVPQNLTGSLGLQYHLDAVAFRNIWVRPVPLANQP